MANTSGSTAFNLDLTELVEEAFERAGSELRTGYDMRTARRSLHIMFADWANRGINLWTIETGTIDLVQGQNTYPLPDPSTAYPALDSAVQRADFGGRVNPKWFNYEHGYRNHFEFHSGSARFGVYQDRFRDYQLRLYIREYPI